MSNYSIIRKQRLVDILDERSILSIVIRPMSKGKRALFIASRDYVPNAFPSVCCTRHSGYTYLVMLGRFTYAMESYIALPKECYKNIWIVEEECNGYGYMKAIITKPIQW